MRLKRVLSGTWNTCFFIRTLPQKPIRKFKANVCETKRRYNNTEVFMCARNSSYHDYPFLVMMFRPSVFAAARSFPVRRRPLHGIHFNIYLQHTLYKNRLLLCLFSDLISNVSSQTISKPSHCRLLLTWTSPLLEWQELSPASGRHLMVRYKYFSQGIKGMILLDREFISLWKSLQDNRPEGLATRYSLRSVWKKSRWTSILGICWQ